MLIRSTFNWFNTYKTLMLLLLMVIMMMKVMIMIMMMLTIIMVLMMMMVVSCFSTGDMVAALSVFPHPTAIRS